MIGTEQQGKILLSQAYQALLFATKITFAVMSDAVFFFAAQIAQVAQLM